MTSILDPACGTAGFLISAYKHVVGRGIYMDGGDPTGWCWVDGGGTRAVCSEVTCGGYDISPDMVRLSLVNLYLHGFPDPDVFLSMTL